MSFWSHTPKHLYFFLATSNIFEHLRTARPSASKGRKTPTGIPAGFSEVKSNPVRKQVLHPTKMWFKDVHHGRGLFSPKSREPELNRGTIYPDCLSLFLW